MHTDPVCGMQVDPGKAAGSSDHHGQTFYFCSKGCKTKFDANPGQYVSPPAVPAAQSHSHTASDPREYTCPMHSEVRQLGPGACCVAWRSSPWWPRSRRTRPNSTT